MPASAPEPSGETSVRARAFRQPFAVAQKHLRVGHQVVRQRHRLRPLQVRVARHDGVQMLFRHIAQRLYHRRAARARGLDFVGQVQPQIQRHLVVAAARRVQLFARLADAAGQLRLHKGVNVLARHVDFERAVVQIRENALQAVW